MKAIKSRLRHSRVCRRMHSIKYLTLFFTFIFILAVFYKKTNLKHDLQCSSSFSSFYSDEKGDIELDVDYSISISAINTVSLSIVGYIFLRDSRIDINRVYEFNIDNFYRSGNLSLSLKSASIFDEDENNAFGKFLPRHIADNYIISISKLMDNVYLISSSQRTLFVCLSD